VDVILDVEYIAEFFKCSLEKVKRMLRSGELPGFKFGGRWYVREKDLEEMVDKAVQSNRHLRRVQEAA
jgi:excisionase family DNA binding protein